MKNIVFLSTILFGMVSQALPELSKIESVDLICEQPGLMFAFDFERGKERVWQSDPGQVEGIELTDVSVTYYRCRNCYDVTASMADGISYEMKIRGRGEEKPKAELKISAAGETQSFTLSCYDRLR